MATRKRRPYLLNQASAYYRVAAKAHRAGRYTEAEYYRRLADRMVERNRAQQASTKARDAARAAYYESRKATPGT